MNHSAVIVCENSNDAVYTEIRSNRRYGRIETKKFAGCIFYYHEADTGGN